MTSIKDHFSAFKEVLKNNHSKLKSRRSYHYYYDSEVKKMLGYDKLPSLKNVFKITPDDFKEIGVVEDTIKQAGFDYTAKSRVNDLFYESINKIIPLIFNGQIKEYNENDIIKIINKANKIQYSKFRIENMKLDPQIIIAASRKNTGLFTNISEYITENKDLLKNEYDILLKLDRHNYYDNLLITNSDIFDGEPKMENLKQDIYKAMISLKNYNTKTNNFYNYLIKETNKDDLIDYVESNANLFNLHQLFLNSDWEYPLTQNLFARYIIDSIPFYLNTNKVTKVFCNVLTKDNLLESFKYNNLGAVALFFDSKVPFNEKHRDIFCRYVRNYSSRGGTARFTMKEFTPNQIQQVVNKFRADYIDLDDDTKIILNRKGIKVEIDKKSKLYRLAQFERGDIPIGLSEEELNYIIENTELRLDMIEKLIKKNKEHKISSKAKGKLYGYSQKAYICKLVKDTDTTKETLKEFIKVASYNKKSYGAVVDLIKELK